MQIRSKVGFAPKASFVDINQDSGPYEEVRAHEPLGFSAAAALDLEVWRAGRDFRCLSRCFPDLRLGSSLIGLHYLRPAQRFYGFSAGSVARARLSSITASRGIAVPNNRDATEATAAARSV